MSSIIMDFLDFLLKDPQCPSPSLQVQIFAGKCFLYTSIHVPVEVMMSYLHEKSDCFAQGTIWRFTCHYIRESKNGIVYQISFAAPKEKSFCCGNQCVNCKWSKKTN